MRAFALLAAALLATCGGESAAAPATIRLDDCAGVAHAPLNAPDGQLTVLVFTSHECPIANAMAPVLAELAERFATRPVRFFMVHVDPDLTAADAAQHARDYRLPGTVLLDPYHDLAQRLHVRRTPEAVVWQNRQVVYRGLIDDQWHDLGARAQSASHEYLRDAITAALAGEPIAVTDTEPVGCLLPEPRPRPRD